MPLCAGFHGVRHSFIEGRYNRLGGLMKLAPSLAKYTRRGVETDSYWFVQSWMEPHQFAEGSIFHLMDPDINQEIYGVPEYLSSLNSIWLNEAATLFRRKYYLNGSHAGFILYMNDAAHKQEDIDNLRKALKESKGPGNFRNLFMYAPGGKPDGLQLIPLAEVAAKDEFLNIKNVTRDDQLAAQRTPPQLMGFCQTTPAVLVMLRRPRGYLRLTSWHRCRNGYVSLTSGQGKR
ncbi:phage portal protein [Serratia surfactantfaciens]|nr:phage portal protein [Serratia surfactantfaciens]